MSNCGTPVKNTLRKVLMRECRLLGLINWVRNYIKVKRGNGEPNTYLTKFTMFAATNNLMHI